MNIAPWEKFPRLPIIEEFDDNSNPLQIPNTKSTVFPSYAWIFALRIIIGIYITADIIPTTPKDLVRMR